MRMFAALVFSLLLISSGVYAHCPLCSAATGMAVATTRLYGIDDIVVGLFIGAFAVSTALWMNNIALKKNRKKEYIPHQQSVFVLFSLAATIATLYFSGLLDLRYRILGVDRIFFGTVTGTVITLLSFEFHKKLRLYNRNKNYLPMQGIILPLLAVAIAGFGFYIMGWLA